MLQLLEHFLRLFAQGIDVCDLAPGVVGVFVDQFFQRRVVIRKDFYKLRWIASREILDGQSTDRLTLSRARVEGSKGWNARLSF